MKSVINLNQTNFADTLSSHDTVLVDFWAPWCAPCISFAPIYEAAADKHPGVVFAKVNVDEAPELIADHQIRAIPTLKVFRAGELVDLRTGAMPAAHLDDVIVHATAA